MRPHLLLIAALALLPFGAVGCGGNTIVSPDGGTGSRDGMSDGPPTGDMGDPFRPGEPKLTMCPGAGMAAPASGTCTVTPGSAARLFTATVLTPGEVLRGGQVLVDDTGMIACVGCDCASQAQGATVITCPTGVLSPGLINSHDHITFQSGPQPDTGERYEQRNDWRKGLRGHTKINSGGTASTAQVRWGELRFVMGGATATVGSGGQAGLLRNLDKAGLQGEKLTAATVDFDTFPLGDSGGAQLSSGCAYPSIHTAAEVGGVEAYYPHVAEGIDDVAHNEFLCVSSSMGGGQDLTQPQSAFIHAVGLTASDYGLMGAESVGLIWSPRSNVSLYGDTARVTIAARLGVQIALGTDWLPSGSMNLLRELRCADQLNANYLDRFFTDEQLWLMATANAATLAAVDKTLGLLAPGRVADLALFDGRTRPDHRAVLAAEPGDVVLVMRGGKVLYGDQLLVSALAPQAACDPIDVCGVSKLACVKDELGTTLAALTSQVGGSNYPLFECATPRNEPTCVPSRPKAVMGSSVYTGAFSGGDDDGDGVQNLDDNCPKVWNPIRPMDGGKQPDHDDDGLGDACDPCPLDAATMTCAAPNPDDPDGDMVPSALDNCPQKANPGQEDSDDDLIGDVCDPCPNAPNAGGQGCPATVYEIKTGAVAVGASVSVSNLLVTGKATNGFFAQVKAGDAGYLGPQNSGIFVYEKATTAKVGDRVDVTQAKVADFYGQLELTGVTWVVKSSGEAPPEPVRVNGSGLQLTAADLATGTLAQALEAVLVELSNVTVTDASPAPGAGDAAPTWEFVVDGALRVNDLLFRPAALPAVGEKYATLTGVLEFRNGNFKVEPRGAADLPAGPPRVVALGPAGFVRVGQTGAIPQPLEIQLSRAATAPVTITLTSADPASLGVPAQVTIPAGAVSAEVAVQGLAATPAPVAITASDGVATVMGGVRVIEAAAAPSLIALQPGMVTVPPGGAAQLTVTLDLPAPAGGVAVALSSQVPGAVPAEVVVPANQLSASFGYTQMGSGMSDTVTATLGVTATAQIAVGLGRLVINEIDYDQPGTDTAEFIELYNGGAGAVDLSTLALVLVNGADKKEYARIKLSGTLQPGSYLVVAQPAVDVDLSATRVTFGDTAPVVQNGDPDGVALIDTATGAVLDALSYGGAITQASISGLTGTRSLVEGSAATAKDTGAGSLARKPNGVDTDKASADWVFTATPTPGSPNL